VGGPPPLEIRPSRGSHSDYRANRHDNRVFKLVRLCSKDSFHLSLFTFHDCPLFAAAFGLRHKAYNRPPTPHSRLDLGSRNE
jgi:hypothetical protein